MEQGDSTAGKLPALYSTKVWLDPDPTTSELWKENHE